MQAVARAAGVAISTASRALREDPEIGALTRQRVRAAAERLGYRINPMVAALMRHLRASRPPTPVCNLAWLDFFDDPAQ